VIYTIIKYLFLGDCEIRAIVMGQKCRSEGENKKCTLILVKKPLGKWPL
jgi:hypothetical protein